VATSIIENVSAFLGFTPEETLGIALKAPTSYKKYEIPKKAGGRRAIHHPSKQTKAVQHAIMEILLSQLPVHRSSYAYRRNIKSPTRTHAERHVQFAYSVRIDFKDFFPSIGPSDLLQTLKKNGGIRLDRTETEFIINALFLRTKGRAMVLAIGAPSSPMVSNVVMYALDEKLMRAAQGISSESAYTRYADDLVFSCNDKGSCKKFYAKVESLIRNTNSPRLTINEGKTLYLSRGTRRTVTGLTITPDHRISLGRSRKRYIRKLVYEFKKHRLNDKLTTYLQGFLAYSLDVEPDFFNRLAIKYGTDPLHEILRQRKK
jgi:RNA-directed DNA polymerase